MPVAHYRDFEIHYWPKPIPTRAHDYEWAHDAYDGGPQHSYGAPKDKRCGTASSLDDAKRQIDEQIECSQEVA